MVGDKEIILVAQDANKLWHRYLQQSKIDLVDRIVKTI